MSSRRCQKRRVFAAVLASVLAGCTDMASDQHSAGQADTQTFVFECPGDFSFVARIEGDTAWLFLPGRTIDLPRTPSDTGVSFASGSDRFRYEGEKALIETTARTHAGCIDNRARAIWEHAKLNGVDFRATGNEPGWYLEISDKDNILLVTDYGNKRYRFDSSAMNSDPNSRTTVYNARAGNDQVDIVIEGVPCQDTMSGEAFQTAVSVQLNDTRLSGCGRALH